MTAWYRRPILVATLSCLMGALVAAAILVAYGVSNLQAWNVTRDASEREVYAATRGLLDDAAAGREQESAYDLSASQLGVLDERLARPEAVNIVGIIQPTAPTALIDYAVMVEVAPDGSERGDYYTVAWGVRDGRLQLLPYQSTLFER